MKTLRLGVVILGALIVTSLGISAGDVFVGNSGSLLGQILSTENTTCPKGMVTYLAGQTFSCIDTYEASAGEECRYAEITSSNETQDNINDAACIPVSVKGAQPWVYVHRMQAQALCARAGKRLPTSAEWYAFSVGTADDVAVCNTASESAALSGSYEHCVSSVGIHDAVGNVWEWTSDTVIEGVLNNRSIPDDGYVVQTDSIGIATLTSEVSTPAYGGDYFWGNASGTFGILKGGFYGSQEDAGIYATHARIEPTNATIATGFRCVR